MSEALRAEQIAAYVRLALAPPDGAVLQRAFAEAIRPYDPPALTDAERRWVALHRECHPGWQQCWRQMEQVEAQQVADYREEAARLEEALRTTAAPGAR